MSQNNEHLDKEINELTELRNRLVEFKSINRSIDDNKLFELFSDELQKRAIVYNKNIYRFITLYGIIEVGLTNDAYRILRKRYDILFTKFNVTVDSRTLPFKICDHDPSNCPSFNKCNVCYELTDKELVDEDIDLNLDDEKNNMVLIKKHRCLACFEIIENHCVLIPCYHAKSCYECSCKFDRCPLCQLKVKAVHKIYL